MNPSPACTRMLASVASAAEARLAVDWGADLIDLKDPTRGALGALPLRTIRDAVAAVAGRRPMSATIGDFPAMQPEEMACAAAAVAATGVDYVKVGFFPCANTAPCLRALSSLADQGVAIIVVLFADRFIDMDLIDGVARHGLAGVMLDTMAKQGRSLRDFASAEALDSFVLRARGRQLLAGLAGSLREWDIEPLLGLLPDYLGFRGGLCANGQRGAALSPGAFARVRAAIPLQSAARVAGSRRS